MNSTIHTDYANLILRNQFVPFVPPELQDQYSLIPVDSQYSILYLPESEWVAALPNLVYYNIPKLFTATNTVSLDTSGITALQYQPFLNLKGKGVLIGFLDSGIDYRHPAFRNSDGSTRIRRIWDQTQSDPFSDVQNPLAPFGTEYSDSDINQAIFTGSELPETDETGHGTSVAGIACGTPDPEADFLGAAPLSEILFVKLRSAPTYLRNYYIIPQDAIAYQETDLMLGFRYLKETAAALQMPIVICFSLGTNQGSHTGDSPLEDVIKNAEFQPGIYTVAGTGNETGKGHHYLGKFNSSNDRVDVELIVAENSNGFTLEFWADAPEIYSLGFTSPLGEIIQPIPARTESKQQINFLLENTQIEITYDFLELLSGSMLIQVRFQDPTPGLWRIRVVNQIYFNGVFHLWLPITGLIESDTRFYTPNPDTTLIIPSCTDACITCSTEDVSTNSLFPNSGRGFTRNGRIKPDFSAPGVDLTAPIANSSSYTTFTGSSSAAALTSGAAALFVESGLIRSIPRFYSLQELKNLFLRGTIRSGFYTYPNQEYGYGSMNVYNSILSFRSS